MENFKTDTSTTGRVVSTFAVLTVLTRNLVTENHLEPAARKGAERELRAIAAGQRGIVPQKVAQRSAERCAVAVLN